MTLNTWNSQVYSSFNVHLYIIWSTVEPLVMCYVSHIAGATNGRISLIHGSDRGEDPCMKLVIIRLGSEYVW